MSKKVILLGQKQAGKTALLQKILDGTFQDKYIETTAVENKVIVDVRIWDLAGDPRFDKITGHFYPNTDAAFYCFDLERYDFKQIKNGILQYRQACNNGKLFLVGTKQDLSEIAEERWHEIQAAVNTALQKRGFTPLEPKWFATSAKTGYGMADLETEISRPIQGVLLDSPRPIQNTRSCFAFFQQPSPDTPNPTTIIWSCMGAFALLGATIGAGLGVGLCITGTVSTLGIALLASWPAIPIMIGICAALGALVGLAVGLGAVACVQNKEDSYELVQ